MSILYILDVQFFMHEEAQSYFDKLYCPYKVDIQKSLCSTSNEIYGELFYYSFVKLLKYLKIESRDHFLDIGSGLGKWVFQVFLSTEASSVTGIEINHSRHEIAYKVLETIQKERPFLFDKSRTLNLIEDDFLNYNLNNFSKITIIYICSTVFSFDLICSIVQKINTMVNVQKVVSLRKLPGLNSFKLSRKIFLQGTWDNSACYLYVRS